MRLPATPNMLLFALSVSQQVFKILNPFIETSQTEIHQFISVHFDCQSLIIPAGQRPMFCSRGPVTWSEETSASMPIYTPSVELELLPIPKHGHQVIVLDLRGVVVSSSVVWKQEG
jgi:hypothetical protein